MWQNKILIPPTHQAHIGEENLASGNKIVPVIKEEENLNLEVNI